MEAAQESINVAFSSNPKLRKRIFDAINETPQHLSLFHDIASHHLEATKSTETNGNSLDSDQHPSKKRKIESEASTGTAQTNQPRSTILEARDLSFILPQRKKLHLSILQYGQDFNGANTTFALGIRNPATNQVELELPLTAFANVLKVPVPEKAQKQYNFCFLPQSQTTGNGTSATEAVICSVNDGPLKSCSISSPELQKLAGTSDILENALNAVLERSGSKITAPTESEFASAIPEAHRKSEKAYHVKAHRGSKDGYLFFLENGIFFGFKKPLAFFPFAEIHSISYTAVLQRTFNLIVTVQSAQTEAEAEQQEIEFAMIDQADFAGIDAYIKNHQLQDSSLADARRAKQYKVNGKVAASAAEGGEPSELQKAEAEMQEEEEDEEDAMEEDYDPGSDGESEGSGSSDDEDDYNNAEGKDLIKEELGSEAEDVSADEDEDGDEYEEEVADEDEEEPAVDEPSNAKQQSKSGFQAISHTPVLPLHPPGGPSFDDEDQL